MPPRDIEPREIDVPSTDRWWVDYAFALMLIAAVTVMRLLLGERLHGQVPFILYFPTIALLAWWVRTGAGLVAIAVSALASWYFFIPPVASFSFSNTEQIPQVVTFVGTTLIIVVVASIARNRQRRDTAIIRRHEQQLRDFFDNANVGIQWVGPDGTILRANAAELRMLGYSKEEYVGRPIVDFHVDRPVIDDMLARLMRGENIEDQPARLRHKDGSIRRVSINSSGYWENDHFVHTRCFMRDVTDEVTAQDESNAAQARLALVANTVPALISYVDTEGRYQMVNEGYRRWFGLDPAAMHGQHVRDALGEAAWETIGPRLTRAFGGETVMYEAELPYNAGSRFVQVHYIPDFASDGHVRGAIALVNDLTDIHRAETYRARLASIVDSSDDAIISTTLDRVVTSWNQSAERLFGYSADEMIGQPLSCLIPDDRRAEEDDLRERLRRGKRVPAFETIRLNKAGERVDVSISLSPVHDSKGTVVAVSKIIRDIREHKRALSIQLATEARFQTMADHAPVMIWLADADMQATWFNRPWLEFVNFDMQHEAGRGWIGSVHDEDQEELRNVLETAKTNRTPYSGKFRLRRSDGVHRWVLGRGVPLVAGQEHLGFICSCIDITDIEDAQANLQRRLNERTKELQDSHERLRFTERLASLGTLAAGLGHDMGNLLVPLRVRLQSLETCDLPASAQADIDGIRTAADYLQKLAGGLRLLALDPSPSTKSDAIDARGWWAESEPILRNALPRGVKLECDIDAGEVLIPLSRPALTQVVFNLVQNAGDAMKLKNAGTVAIGIECTNDHCVVRVRDDGPGMSADVRARCLEPFFTTKTRAVSTGLGLSIVHGLVREAGGTISIESAPGDGTSFIISLPRAEQATEPLTPLPARVDVDDVRLKAFIKHELAHHAFRLIASDDAESHPQLIVIDGTKLQASNHGANNGSTIISLGEPADPTQCEAAVILATIPKPQDLRDALRTTSTLLRKRQTA